MLKYLLLGLLIAWLIFASPWRRKHSGGTPSRKPAAPPPQHMVACAHCGVHMPASEALVGPSAGAGPRHFCSEDHRRAGPRAR